jgi:hypothetical protein
MIIKTTVSEKSSEDIGLKDGNKTNILYISKRSAFSYVYVKTFLGAIINKLIKSYLKKVTGINFNNRINELCLPINGYQTDEFILMHRDRDMFNPTVKVKDIAVITIAQEGVSEFTIYKNVKASSDGKKIEILPETISNTIQTEPGQIIVFDNLETAHSLICVYGERLSLTYRSNLV